MRQKLAGRLDRHKNQDAAVEVDVPAGRLPPAERKSAIVEHCNSLKRNKPMPYGVKHLPEFDAIQVAFYGVVTGADLKGATTEGISLAKLTGATKALIDANGCEVIASLMDIYDLPADQYSNQGLVPATPIAVILPTSVSGRQAAHDYALFCHNRGWNVRICPEHQAAIDWLTGTKSD